MLFFLHRREFLIFVFTFGFFARQIFKYWRLKHSALVRASLAVVTKVNFVGFLVRLFSIILSFKERNSLTLNLPCGDLELEVRRKTDDDKVRSFLHQE